VAEGLRDFPKTKAGFNGRDGKPIQVLYSPQQRAEVQEPSVPHLSFSHSPATLLPAYEKNPDRFISQSPSLISTLWDMFTRRAHRVDLISHPSGALTVTVTGSVLPHPPLSCTCPLLLPLHCTATFILCKNWCEPCRLWTGKSVWFLCGNLHFEVPYEHD